ncbi:sensor histidine kinase [Enterococcus sp. AZ072]|uniref:sensor histidine kinase n=1 Tax=unclassified Enterococcus TaxID=2608891 RepID=UPI003D2D2BDA
MLLILPIVFLMNRKSKRHHSLPAHVAFLYIAIVLVCFTISSYVLFSTDKFLVSSHMILLIMYYFSFKVIEKVHEQNYQHQLNEKKLVLENQYYQKVEQHQEEVRMLKHDMKNQLLGIQAYYQEQQYEKLGGLLTTLVQKSVTYEKTFFTSNKLVNLIVADKIGLAKEREIDCSVEIVIPSELAIADNDLINVLSNILDNAIEACGYCEDGAFIFLEVFLKRHCLFVHCKNSTDGLHHSLDTRKKSGDHGLGLKSMRAVVDNYNGELTYKWEDKQFSIEVLLFEDHI